MNKILIILVLVLAVGAGWLILAPILNNQNTNDAVDDVNQQPEDGDVVLKTNMGDIVLDLFEEELPITAGNFLKLAKEGFYNGIKFHRVIDGFMIQGGDPLTKDDSRKNAWGTGGPGYAIKDEFVVGQSNLRGTVAMANTGQSDSGGSQFFINLVDNTQLDFNKEPLTSKHPVFGKVVAGMEIVDLIGKSETGSLDRPLKDVIIEKVEVLK